MSENVTIQAGDEGADKLPENSEIINNGKEDAGSGGEGEDASLEGKDSAKAPQSNLDDDGVEPVVRKRLSTQDFIIGRQRAKLAKSQEKDDGGSDDDGEEPVAPEDEELITKVVAKQLAPIINKSLEADDNQEISDFLTENPDFKPFEAKARRYMTHPSRRSLPIKSIFYEVAGDNLLRMGAERGKLADEKARNSQTGGGSNRAGEGTKGVNDLTPDEFRLKQERVRRGE